MNYHIDDYKSIITRQKLYTLDSTMSYVGSLHMEILENFLIKSVNPKIVVSPRYLLKIARMYETDNKSYDRRLIHLMKYPENSSSFEYNRVDLKNKVLWFYGLQIPLIMVDDLEDENIFGIIGEADNDLFLMMIMY